MHILYTYTFSSFSLWLKSTRLSRLSNERSLIYMHEPLFMIHFVCVMKIFIQISLPKQTAPPYAISNHASSANLPVCHSLWILMVWLCTAHPRSPYSLCWLVINELLPSERYFKQTASIMLYHASINNYFHCRFSKQNMLLVGLWYGSVKPVMTTFLKPLMDELNHLLKHGEFIFI